MVYLSSFDIALVLGALSLQSWSLGRIHWPEGKFFLIWAGTCLLIAFLSPAPDLSSVSSALGQPQIVWWVRMAAASFPCCLSSPCSSAGEDPSLSHSCCLLCVHLSYLCSAKEQARDWTWSTNWGLTNQLKGKPVQFPSFFCTLDSINLIWAHISSFS